MSRLSVCLLALVLAGCSSTDDISFPSPVLLDLTASETTVGQATARLESALRTAPPVSIIATVDHEANAAGAGLSLRPTRVVLFGNPMLGTPIMQANQQAGLDLPQKMLVYEDEDGFALVGYNPTEYLVARHGVGDVGTLEQIAMALQNFAGEAAGTEVETRRTGGTVSPGEGIVAVESANSVDRTFARLRSAIEDNPNLSVVAELDHQANAASVGLTLRPTRLIVFGNPALGTPLMQAAQTIAIDLPQKMLVYEEADGDVMVAYNNPAYLALRHGITGQDDVLGMITGALDALAQAAIGIE